MTKPKDKMQSNGVAELRRAYEDVIEANRLLEIENARLRELAKRVKPEEPKQVKVQVVEPLKPGQFVDYLPQGGKEGTVPKLAIVLEVKPNGFLKLRVCRTAMPDVVLDDVGPTRWRARP